MLEIIAGSIIRDEEPLSTSSCSPSFLIHDTDELVTKENEQVSAAGGIHAGNAEIGGTDWGDARWPYTCRLNATAFCAGSTTSLWYPKSEVSQQGICWHGDPFLAVVAGNFTHVSLHARSFRCGGGHCPPCPDVLRGNPSRPSWASCR